MFNIIKIFIFLLSWNSKIFSKFSSFFDFPFFNIIKIIIFSLFWNFQQYFQNFRDFWIFFYNKNFHIFAFLVFLKIPIFEILLMPLFWNFSKISSTFSSLFFSGYSQNIFEISLFSRYLEFFQNVSWSYFLIFDRVPKKITYWTNCNVSGLKKGILLHCMMADIFFILLTVPNFEKIQLWRSFPVSGPFLSYSSYLTCFYGLHGPTKCHLGLSASGNISRYYHHSNGWKSYAYLNNCLISLSEGIAVFPQVFPGLCLRFSYFTCLLKRNEYLISIPISLRWKIRISVFKKIIKISIFIDFVFGEEQKKVQIHQFKGQILYMCTNLTFCRTFK